MKNYKWILPVLLFSCFLTGIGQDEFSEGTRRWKVKVSVPDQSSKKTKTLAFLLKLPKPVAADSRTYEDSRIPKVVKGLKEGDIITTKGWLHLVALEKDQDGSDGDYHIQISNSGESGDSCFIVEIPYPKFVKDPELRQKCQKARDFVKTRLLKGKEPGTGGNIMQHEVYVQVTGQLYFDSPHVKGKPRGKRGMKSYTAWELHPVTDMRFGVVK